MEKGIIKKFFIIFLIIAILNTIFTLIVYHVSPDLVPEGIKDGVFTDYKSKTESLMFILMPLMVFGIGSICYLFVPLQVLIFKFWLKIYVKMLGDKLGNTLISWYRWNFGILQWLIGYEEPDLKSLFKKFILVFILVFSTMLLPMNFVTLGFALEFRNLEKFLSGFIIVIILLIIPLFRIYGKALK